MLVLQESQERIEIIEKFEKLTYKERVEEFSQPIAVTTGSGISDVPRHLHWIYMKKYREMAINHKPLKVIEKFKKS